MRHVAVEVGGRFPGADRGQVLGAERRRLPLVLAVIGDSVEADLPVRPRLHPAPPDPTRQSLPCAPRPDVADAGRAPGAATVHANTYISVGNPFFRVDHLPALILVGRPGWHIRVLLAHHSPLIRVEILEVQPFSVRAISHDHGVLALGDGTEHVGAQHESVIHRNRDIPVDSHSVPDLTLLSRSHRSPSLLSEALCPRLADTRNTRTHALG